MCNVACKESHITESSSTSQACLGYMSIHVCKYAKVETLEATSTESL